MLWMMASSRQWRAEEEALFLMMACSEKWHALQ
jgi:hypothetical protein